MNLRGPQVLALTFLGLILIGAFVLELPMMSTSGRRLAFLDALFLSTSAVCVTGLVVNNTALDMSFAGQMTLLVLIQLGGLGIMTVSAALLSILNRSVDTASSLTLSETYSGGRSLSLKRLMLSTLSIVIVCEAVGAAILYTLLEGPDSRTRLWNAIFHSVSAFCNAGFSIYPNGLMDIANQRAVLIVIMVLIVIGGLGFFVILDLIEAFLHRSRTRSLRIQTKLVLMWSLFLTIGGMLGIQMSEFDGILSTMSPGDQILHSLFQSVTARTAGFNTIDVAQMNMFGLFVLMALMFIGGSPGSCAGGVKTTTIGIVFAALASHLRGREDAEVFGRRIPRGQVQMAFVLISMSIVLMFAVFLVMRTFGGYAAPPAHATDSLIRLGFETVSAFCTVGLSAGVTPMLTPLSKISIILLMFIGRLGPLTFAIAVSFERRPLRYRLPAESVMVG